ncbi:MAG: hypothetical protein JOZ54_12620 [Acidobacteria bacterium]|nr:hypothetical protein [Acidobacteriota bacterium]
MIRSLLLSLILLSLCMSSSAAELTVQLTLDPQQTLPALPVWWRVRIVNHDAQPVAIRSSMTVSTTDANGTTRNAQISMPPQYWTSDPRDFATHTLAGNATLDLFEPAHEFLHHAMFDEPDLGLWMPGTYDVVVAIVTDAGVSFRSNTAHLNVALPGAEDVAVWNAMTDGGKSPLRSALLLDHVNVLRAHPASQYSKNIEPMFSNAGERDPDRYAAALASAAPEMSAAFRDAAQLSIVMHYLESAGGAAAGNDAPRAGELSAKGRVHAQALIDSPGTSISAAVGTSAKVALKTTEEWQAYYDRAHPPSSAVDVKPIADCRTDNGDGTFTWKFGYESAMANDVTLAAGSKINAFVPTPGERGQPSVFHSGVHHEAVVVTRGPANLTWNLAKGRTVDFSAIQAPPPPPSCATVGID